jgi:hypothetical protein
MKRRCSRSATLRFVAVFVDGCEFVDVQTFIAKPAVKRLAQAIIRGLARPREVQLHTVPRGPLIKGFGGELAAIVGGD